MNAERVRIQTLHWIETIVIGLDLCPFGAVALADCVPSFIWRPAEVSIRTP